MLLRQCGVRRWFWFEPNHPTQPPFVQYKVKPHDPNEQQGTAKQNSAAAKPNCDLSVAGFVLSVFNPLMCVIAFILCAAALIKKQVRRKLALAGFFISLIEMVAIAVGVLVVIYVLPAKGIDISQYLPFLKHE